LLYKDAKSIEEVWSKIDDTYVKNENFFSKDQSVSFTNNVINDYVSIFTYSYYSNKYSENGN